MRALFDRRCYSADAMLPMTSIPRTKMLSQRLSRVAIPGPDNRRPPAVTPFQWQMARLQTAEATGSRPHRWGGHRLIPDANTPTRPELRRLKECVRLYTRGYPLRTRQILVGVVLVVNFFRLRHHGAYVAIKSLTVSVTQLKKPSIADQGIEPMTKRLSHATLGLVEVPPLIFIFIFFPFHPQVFFPIQTIPYPPHSTSYAPGLPVTIHHPLLPLPHYPSFYPTLTDVTLPHLSHPLPLPSSRCPAPLLLTVQARPSYPTLTEATHLPQPSTAATLLQWPRYCVSQTMQNSLTDHLLPFSSSAKTTTTNCYPTNMRISLVPCRYFIFFFLSVY
ncbi:hypothetical protein VP01_240g1 [Puccinia sorghi]|uniref:Uncharacterized protein n=1 Tax=Puccinia sorghi TaxID=27349 RepID=A0A0L6V7B9_9BASI|nr:hypothetical protein VP01_240g1 [Puccinia sorghi]